MTAPTGIIGPNRDLFEQRLRTMQAQIDALGQRGGALLTGDTEGGIATPWIPIPLYAKFAVAAGLYTAMARAVDTTERTLWEGRIGYLSHPRIQVTGTWGVTSGSNNTEYRLKLNGTTVGTWTVNTAAATDSRGPYDPLTVPGLALGSKDIAVVLTAKTLSGTGNYACQVLGCHQRSSS